MNHLLSDLTSPKKSFGYSLKTTTEFIYIIFLFHNFFPFGHPVWMPIFNIKYYSFLHSPLQPQLPVLPHHDPLHNQNESPPAASSD